MGKFWRLLGSIVVSELAGIIGGIFTATSVKTWLPTLVRPSFAPPDWLFMPVWTILYLLMGIALFLVWEKRRSGEDVTRPLVLFGIQLLLNILWPAVFFGLTSLGGGLVVIVILWFAIVATVLSFFRVSRAAGWLLVPYLLWVTYAVVLNFAYWRLNP